MIIQQNLYFSDAGAFCDAVQGFDVEFRQLDRGPLSANLSFLVTAECSIQDVSFTRRFHQKGIGPTDMLSFGLPDESTLRNWRGAPISESRLLNFSRPGGYDSVSEKGFSAYTFAVSERLLQAELDAQGSAIRAADLQASGDWRLPDANLASLLRSIGYQAISNETAIAEQPARVAKLQSSLVHVIAQIVIADEIIESRISAEQRNQAIGRSLELIHTGSDAISIRDIQSQSGVCWRTLNRAFNDRFGIGPKQYLVSVRLAAVRKDLQSASSEKTITEMAGKWGFGHMGRFSSSYREMFGELPSVTLLK